MTPQGGTFADMGRSFSVLPFISSTAGFFSALQMISCFGTHTLVFHHMLLQRSVCLPGVAQPGSCPHQLDLLDLFSCFRGTLFSVRMFYQLVYIWIIR